MVVAAEDRNLSQAHPNAADHLRTGGGARSATGLSAEGRPSAAATHGEEDPGLSRPGRPRFGGPPPAPPPPPPVTDATTALLHAIRVTFVNFAGFVLEEIRSRRWASVTFRGARHELVFRLEGEGAEDSAARFLSGLQARNFPLRGHLVADVSLVDEERRPGFARVRLEARTVEDE